MIKNTLTPSQAAKELSVSTETLRRYETEGLIASEKTAGGHRRFSKEEIEAFKNERVRNTKIDRIDNSRQSFEDNLYAIQKAALISFLNDLGIDEIPKEFKKVNTFSGELYSPYSSWLACPLELKTSDSKSIVGFLLVDDDEKSIVIYFMPNREGFNSDFALCERAINAFFYHATYKNNTFIKPLENAKDLRENLNNYKKYSLKNLLYSFFMFLIIPVLGIGMIFPIFSLAAIGVIFLILLGIYSWIASSLYFKGYLMKGVSEDSSFVVSSS